MTKGESLSFSFDPTEWHSRLVVGGISDTRKLCTALIAARRVEAAVASTALQGGKELPVGCWEGRDVAALVRDFSDELDHLPARVSLQVELRLERAISSCGIELLILLLPHR